VAEPITICDEVFLSERDSGSANQTRTVRAGNSFPSGITSNFRIDRRITSAEPVRTGQVWNRHRYSTGHLRGGLVCHFVSPSTDPRSDSRLYTAGSLVKESPHGRHDPGRPECGRSRGLGHEPPNQLKWVRDHDELVRVNQPMQLIEVRVNTWLAGSGPSLLSSIPGRIVDDITGYLESFQHSAIKETKNRERRVGGPPGA